MIKTNCCNAEWGGLNTAHCSACHETFATIHGFDRHRSQGGCLPPASVGLVRSDRAYRCWSQPYGLSKARRVA